MSNVDNEQAKTDVAGDGTSEKEASVDAVSTEDAVSTKDTVSTTVTTEPEPGNAPEPDSAVAATPTDEEIKAVEEEAVTDTAVKEESVDAEAVTDTAVEDEAVEDEAIEDQTAQGTKEVSRVGGVDRRQAVRRYWPFAAMGLTTLVLIAGMAWLISEDDKDSPAPSPSQAAPQKTPPEQLERFTDQEGGFSLSYPKAWRRIPVPVEGSDLRLVLSTEPQRPAEPGKPNPTGNDGMWVRVIPPSQVEQKYKDFDVEIKGLTGDKPCGTEGSACLRQEQVSVAGMTGIRFIYTTPDALSGQNSIHVQYFLRRNQQGNLYVMVFQAVPTSDLAGLAPAFDEVVASFQAA